MLHIIGLGLNENGISLEGKGILDRCEKIYLESYTVDFPYSFDELEKELDKKIIPLERGKVESDFLIKESDGKHVALLVYGCPLFATTHMSLVSDTEKKNVKVNLVYSTSVFDAIAETGLQLYKFGKITSMPAWKGNYEPDSFMEVVEENKSIDAHSLILVDIGLDFKKALIQLGTAAHKRGIELGDVIVYSKAGTSEKKISYGSINYLKEKDFEKPFCFIIPSKMHFFEKEILEIVDDHI